MGKRIIQQARGKGSLTYRVRKKAFIYRVKYPMMEGAASIIKLIHSSAHSAPLIRGKIENIIFYNPAFSKAVEGSAINIGGNEVREGNILALKNIPIGTRVFNIERNPGDGGRMIRSSGSSAIVSKIYENNKIGVTMPNRKEVLFDENCRASVGIIAGDGKGQKPFIKAGRKYYKMRARGKLWPRISAVSTNAVDHPFGSGRGKRIKSKTAKRNAPPGRKVGHLRPSRTGKRK